jgi:hypothetical protein
MEEPVLNARQVDQFTEEGFVRLVGAFPRAIADADLPALCMDGACAPVEIAIRKAVQK